MFAAIEPPGGRIASPTVAPASRWRIAIRWGIARPTPISISPMNPSQIDPNADPASVEALQRIDDEPDADDHACPARRSAATSSAAS